MWQPLILLLTEHIPEFIERYDLVVYLRHFMQSVLCVWIVFAVAALLSIIITAVTDGGTK